MSTKNNPSQSSSSEKITTASEKKQNFDKLLTKLDSRGISIVEFAAVDEKRRKRMLQDEYQDIKNEGAWQYDERIELSPEVLQKEKDLQKAKLEAASKTK